MEKLIFPKQTRGIVSKKINLSTVKTFSSLVVGLLVLLISTFSSVKVFKKITSETKKNFYITSANTLDGYHQSIKFCLEVYKNSLDLFHDKEMFLTGTSEEISSHLKKYEKIKNVDFQNIFYVDTNNDFYFTDKEEKINYDFDFINSLQNNNSTYNITDTIKEENSQLFLISKKIFDANQTLKGVLCATIRIETLTKLLKNIDFKEHDPITIIDSQGRFIFHQDPSQILKTYTPKNPKYKNQTSAMIATLTEGIIETEATDGKPIDLLFTKIEGTNWTLGYKIPKTIFQNYFSGMKKSIIHMLLISLVTMIVLVIIEGLLFNFIQKKQLFTVNYDSITYLWTRQHFEKEATRLIRHNKRAKFMLIECDIRNFKFINQNYGVKQADKLIRFYSKLLNRACGEMHGIIGRGFADHFYLLIKVTSVNNAMAAFKKQIEKITDEIKKYEIPFFPKYGITFLRPDEKNNNATIQSLIGQASFAKSTIKDSHLTPYSIYNSKLLKKINEETLIEASMEEALKNKEFFVLYQPKISLSTEKIVGAEALVRWNSSKLGFLAPDRFIPLFERNGFITKLDYYVYDEVFTFLDKMIERGDEPIPISVNMARNHNKPQKFIHDFMEIFNRHKVPAKYIQLELIERSFMSSETMKEIINSLHKKGFSVAMDDFGSGESSLNVISKIPVDVLKFDREFLLSSTNKNGELDKKTAKFIEILVELSKSLEKETVFEGVETKAQRDFLKSINCDQAQGYFYSKPLSEQEFLKFVKSHK